MLSMLITSCRDVSPNLDTDVREKSLNFYLPMIHQTLTDPDK